tara:strand:+ start:550 stop:951 length:402 start_codon:yes stop_codon:yes gene_type:complete
MPDYNLRLMAPPVSPPLGYLRVQTLPCEGRWWWHESPEPFIECWAPDGYCDVVVTSPFSPGLFVRGFFVYDITEMSEAEVKYESSGPSLVISYGCHQDAPPQPVPESDITLALAVGVFVVIALFIIHLERLRG